MVMSLLVLVWRCRRGCSINVGAHARVVAENNHLRGSEVVAWRCTSCSALRSNAPLLLRCDVG